MIENKKDDIIEKLVHINRITKVVKGGRRFGFSALVVVGNQNGKIGIAHAKAKQVPDAIKKVNSIENYLELMATKTKELGIKISSTPSSPLSTPREAPIELNQISTI